MTPTEKDALDLKYAKATADTIASLVGCTTYVVRVHDERGYIATFGEWAVPADVIGQYGPDGTWTAAQ